MNVRKRAGSVRANPILVGIVGGSGSGKTWLADTLEAKLAPNVARLSQDDFYHDRSHLPPARRARLNFDHPRAIDWRALERVLGQLLAGRTASVPLYDFHTHCRRPGARSLKPKPLILVDGLWLLRRASVRRMLSFSVFLDCPTALRLRRRLARDQHSRGRGAASVTDQFCKTVQPMHSKFVAPQKRWADLVLPQRYGRREVNKVIEYLQCLAS